MARKDRTQPTASRRGTPRRASPWLGEPSVGVTVGLVSLIVVAFAAAPQILLGTAGAATTDTVTRTLPDRAFCGDTVEVTLEVSPPAGTSAWLVDEVPPSGATIGSVDPAHNGNATAGHVKWVSLSGDAATVTYNVTIPEDTADGTQLAFDGEYRFHEGMSSRASISGDDTLTVDCGTVERSMPAQASCGETVEVALTVDAPESASAWLIDEVPPSSLTVSDVDPSLNGAFLEGHAKWVSTSGDDATVTYNVSVPSDAAHGDVLAFDGTHRLFPAMEERAAISGPDSLEVVCPATAGASVHAFDANADCLFSESELFSLIDGWKHSGADEAPVDEQLFTGIQHWKLLPEPYCTVGG